MLPPEHTSRSTLATLQGNLGAMTMDPNVILTSNEDVSGDAACLRDLFDGDDNIRHTPASCGSPGSGATAACFMTSAQLAHPSFAILFVS